MKIHLLLCDRCRDAVLRFPTEHSCMVDGYAQMPPLCAECGGKVSQIVRILLTGGVVESSRPE
jgi:hypothetical protein